MDTPKPIATVFQFPSKEERRWTDVFQELSKHLDHLGANPKEIKLLQPRIRKRWESLGKPFEIKLQHQLTGPLTKEQLDSIAKALQEQSNQITNYFKVEQASTLIEFAKLEFKIIRLNRDD